MFAKYPSLKDMAVFITGGGSGIGASLVEAFADQGARVAFLDVKEEESNALVEKLSNAAYQPHFIHCDVTDVDALREAVDEARLSVGPIGVLVNNAGRDNRHQVDDVTPEYWDDVLAANLRHQFFAAQAVRPHMRERGSGSIINFSSVTWIAGGASVVAYGTAKAGVVGLSNTLAREMGHENIRVNAIAPGAVITERQLRLYYSEEQADELANRQFIKKRLLPEEIARSVLFLASEDSRMITKQCLVVDAGLI